MNKKKIYKWSKKYINTSNLKTFILLTLVLIIFSRGSAKEQYDFSSFFDISILFSFLLLFACELLSTLLAGFINSRCEDAAKLTEDYAQLNKKYCCEQKITYGETEFPEVCIAFRTEQETAFAFELEADTEYPMYQLPKQIADHSDELMNAHEYSTVYNNINVRINDCRQDGHIIRIRYGKTTYFDSLITNRAMDYPFQYRTVREIYEPGPFISPLSESKLSNHLGFNGFVRLADENIIFIHRNANVSIAKNMLSTSVSASYKTKYGLDENRHMTSASISNAIRMEIKEELKLEMDTNIDLTKSIFAFYRDLVEGGKPQFLFYVRLDDVTKEQFLSNFHGELQDREQKRDDHKAVITDGTRFEFFTVAQLRHFQYQMDGIVSPEGVKYKMMPGSVASIVLLLRYLEA